MLAALAPALAAASSISGTVTAAGEGPIEGIEVCARPEPHEFATDCVETDVAGSYSLLNLPAADYRIRFSADASNLRYVSEYYDDAVYSYEADLFELEAEEAATVDADLAEGGSISGRVVDETTAEPIEGLWPCASAEWIVRCGPTNANGEYIINGLPTNTYKVGFWGENAVNYLAEWYDDSPTIGTSTAVEVTAPATTPGRDAELAPGAQILGRVTEFGTGAPLEGELVCAEEPGFEGYEQAGCGWTEESGEYAIRGLPAGTYIVSFGLEYAPEFGSPIRGQWWQGASSREEAEPIVIAPPETRADINGVLPNP
ncbi:MAG TPA: carboxypeptidase regulatory-like domain-containing protein, partial [Solirubrobacterales bacterium]|nr:carboxypeptidase regulatory-like domain-containing protein [Solirubrobacterales bacterium]